MQCFWSHGYCDTSLDDLLASTRLSKSSLYGAFGDKHALYIDTLERYAQQQQALLRAGLGRGGLLRARLLALLRAVAQDAAERQSKGCLMLAALAERGRTDADVQRVARANAIASQQIVEAALKRAVAAGEIQLAASAADAAAFVLGLVASLRVQGRSGADAASLTRQAEIGLRGLAF